MVFQLDISGIEVIALHPQNMQLISSTSDLIMQEDYALGQITPFIGSKSWVSLKLWFLMKNLGVSKIGKIIERRHQTALDFANMIASTEDFVLLNDVNINSVVFMYTAGNKNYSIDKLNTLNKSIQEEMLRDGKYYLHKFSLPDDKGILSKGAIVYPLRYMSGNDNITKKDLRGILNYIREIAKKFI